MKATIGTTEFEVVEIATLLNTLLANEYILYTKTRNAYWNVKGFCFSELQLFFKTQYEQLNKIVDATAERIRSLGHIALGSMRDFINLTNLVEENHDFNNHKQIIKILVTDHDTIIRILRNEIFSISNKYKDLVTVDFVTGLMVQHQKMVWMLRYYLS